LSSFWHPDYIFDNTTKYWKNSIAAPIEQLLYNQMSTKIKEGESRMDGLLSVGGLVAGIISIIAGIVVLIWPKVLAYIIGIYLIIVGLVAVITVLR
jgi:hypothetical protein